MQLTTNFKNINSNWPEYLHKYNAFLGKSENQSSPKDEA